MSPRASTFERLLGMSFGSLRRAWLTVIAGVLLIGVLAWIAPTIAEVRTAGDDGPPANAASIQAQDRRREAFPARDDTLPAVIAVHTDSPASTTAATVAVIKMLQNRAGGDTLAPISALCMRAEMGLRPGPDCIPGDDRGSASTDGRTRTVVVPVVGDPTTAEFREVVDDIRTRVKDSAGDGATTHVTGPAGIITDTVKVFASGDRVLLAGTITLVLVILLVVYRSPLLALLPLLSVGIAMRLAETVGALLAKAGVIEVSAQTASIMTVLLFGVGTDYALIITARYREELRDAGPDGDRPAAMVRAMGRTVEVLAASAGTIVLAMMALLFTTSPSLRGFGPYLALGVASMAVVAVTVFPALVVIAGRAAFWPEGRDRSISRVDSALWRRVARIVDSRPVMVVLLTSSLLVGLSAGALGYKESFNFLTGFRVDTDSVAGQELISRDIGPGEIAPTTLLIEGSDLTRGTITAVAAHLDRLPDVAHAAAGARDITAAKDRARIRVVLNRDPYAIESLNAISGLEQAARDALKADGRADVQVTATGETAETADVRAALDDDLVLLVPVMLLLIGAVLAVLLRSLLAPIYLMAALLLSFAATVGLTVLIAVTAQGNDGIGNRVTVYVLVFLIALGVDYTIFLVSRLRQELDRGADMRSALSTALVRTGGVVSSAGVILAATFSVLMTQPIRELYQFGLAMALGILLDTFVVRPLLVPGVVRLLGRHALWPYRPQR